MVSGICVYPAWRKPKRNGKPDAKPCNRLVFNRALAWCILELCALGLYYGALLVLEKFFLLRVLKKLPGWCHSVYTLLLTMTGWCVFSCQDMNDSAAYLRAFFFRADAGLFCTQDAYLLWSNAGLFLLAVIGCTSLAKRAALAVLPKSDFAGIAYIAAVFAASLAMLVSSSYNPFLYFRF